MSEETKTNALASLAEALETSMLLKYGPLLTGDALREALGYRSMDAMRQAILRGTIPVPVFQIEHRRGKFALVKDVAIWLAEQRNRVSDMQISIETDTTKGG